MLFEFLIKSHPLRRETTPEPTQLGIIFIGVVIFTGLMVTAYTFLKPTAPKTIQGRTPEPIPDPDPRAAFYCFVGAGATIFLTRRACRWVEGSIHPFGD